MTSDVWDIIHTERASLADDVFTSLRMVADRFRVKAMACTTT